MSHNYSETEDSRTSSIKVPSGVFWGLLAMVTAGGSLGYTSLQSGYVDQNYEALQDLRTDTAVLKQMLVESKSDRQLIWNAVRNLEKEVYSDRVDLELLKQQTDFERRKHESNQVPGGVYKNSRLRESGVKQ